MLSRALGATLRRYASLYERRPIPLAVGTAVVVKTAADVCAQSLVERRPVDQRRTVAVALFAASVGGYGAAAACENRYRSRRR